MKYLQNVSQRAILILGMLKLLQQDLVATLEFAWGMFLSPPWEEQALSIRECSHTLFPSPKTAASSKKTLGKVRQALPDTMDYQEVFAHTSHPDLWVTADVCVWPGVSSSNLHHQHTWVASGSVCWSSNPSTALFPKKPAVLSVKLLTTCWGGVRSLQQGWCSLVTHCHAAHHLMGVNSFIKASRAIPGWEWNKTKPGHKDFWHRGIQLKSRAALNHSGCGPKWNQDLRICTDTKETPSLRQEGMVSLKDTASGKDENHRNSVQVGVTPRESEGLEGSS